MHQVLVNPIILISPNPFDLTGFLTQKGLGADYLNGCMKKN